MQKYPHRNQGTRMESTSSFAADYWFNAPEGHSAAAKRRTGRGGAMNFLMHFRCAIEVKPKGRARTLAAANAWPQQQ